MLRPTVNGIDAETFLAQKKGTLFVKRAFDILASAIGLILLLPLFLIIALWIRIDSKGPIFFRQERMGRRAEPFRIFKFRTMVNDAERKGRQITVENDSRITKAGQFLRKWKIDELPQLINVLIGDMSLVGPRPEVPKYLPYYTNEDLATLWIRPGITAASSVLFRDESEILAKAKDPDREYIERILPKKNALNQEYVREFSLLSDIKTIFKTFRAL